MLGNIGFSYVGLIFILMLTIPNLIWTKNKPKGYDYKSENKAFVLFEKVGQVLVTCCALFFADFNLKSFTNW